MYVAFGKKYDYGENGRGFGYARYSETVCLTGETQDELFEAMARQEVQVEEHKHKYAEDYEKPYIRITWTAVLKVAGVLYDPESDFSMLEDNPLEQIDEVDLRSALDATPALQAHRRTMAEAQAEADRRRKAAEAKRASDQEASERAELARLQAKYSGAA